MLCNAGGGVSDCPKKCYECVRFNVISVTRGWVGVKFPGKKLYVPLELPIIYLLIRHLLRSNSRDDFVDLRRDSKHL